MDDLVIAIEIFVTHESKDEKIEIISKLNLPAIEIDLSHFYTQNKERCKDDIVFVENGIPGLIANLTLKKWLRLPLDHEIAGKLKVAQPRQPIRWEKVFEVAFIFFGGVVVVWLFCKLVSWIWNRLIKA